MACGPRNTCVRRGRPRVRGTITTTHGISVVVTYVNRGSCYRAPNGLSRLTVSTDRDGLMGTLTTAKGPVVLVLGRNHPHVVGRLRPLTSTIVSVLLPKGCNNSTLTGVLTKSIGPDTGVPCACPQRRTTLAACSCQIDRRVSGVRKTCSCGTMISIR